MAEESEKDYVIEREGTEVNLIIKWKDPTSYPSLENNPVAMENTVNKIIEAGSVTSVIFEAERNYIYPLAQAQLLNELAALFIKLVKEKRVLSIDVLSEKCRKVVPEYLVKIREIVGMLKSDPIGAYLTGLRHFRTVRSRLKMAKEGQKKCLAEYAAIIEGIVNDIGNLKMIKLVKDKLPGYKVGDRELYTVIFEPIIKPNFMYTRLISEPPMRAEIIDSYRVGENDIAIYELPNKIRYLYHIIPPEYKLDEVDYALLDEARQIMVKFKPRREEFINPQRMREVFFNIGKDLIEELARNKDIKMSYKKVEKLAKILMRLTVGFGLIEVLLEDEKVEDIYVNAPVGASPIIFKHAIHGECETNIYPNLKEARAWASRFRMLSGRPLDEANPVLDTELETKKVRARVAVIQEPLSPKGLAFAFRRHRERPWTLPLFMKVKMFPALAAGLLSFLVDGARTMLVAGTRGSGKTSVLQSLLIEIMRRYRIITIEDTLELPVNYMRNIGYNVVSMKVRSAIVGSRSELSAADGIRTSLRLGDSSLIVGEIRSEEAKALYEAMRIGALANVVAGTIHGESAYGVFDRVVNDLGVPRTSFKASDIIMIANKLRDPSGLREVRRLTEITEIRKDWEEDPLREHGFVTLMTYDSKKGELVPTRSLLDGESEVLKSVAGRVKEWAGNWDAVWDNINLRARVKKMIVDYAEKTGIDELYEADFVVEANDAFHKIFSKLTSEVGYPESSDVLRLYEDWLKQRIREFRKEMS